MRIYQRDVVLLADNYVIEDADAYDRKRVDEHYG